MTVVTTDLLYQEFTTLDDHLYQELLFLMISYTMSYFVMTVVTTVLLYQEFTILDDLLYQELLCYDCCYNCSPAPGVTLL